MYTPSAFPLKPRRSCHPACFLRRRSLRPPTPPPSPRLPPARSASLLAGGVAPQRAAAPPAGRPVSASGTRLADTAAAAVELPTSCASLGETPRAGRRSLLPRVARTGRAGRSRLGGGSARAPPRWVRHGRHRGGGRPRARRGGAASFGTLWTGGGGGGGRSGRPPPRPARRHEGGGGVVTALGGRQLTHGHCGGAGGGRRCG